MREKRCVEKFTAMNFKFFGGILTSTLASVVASLLSLVNSDVMKF